MLSDTFDKHQWRFVARQQVDGSTPRQVHASVHERGGTLGRRTMQQCRETRHPMQATEKMPRDAHHLSTSVLLIETELTAAQKQSIVVWAAK
jgi:hypothetical protein